MEKLHSETKWDFEINEAKIKNMRTSNQDKAVNKFLVTENTKFEAGRRIQLCRGVNKNAMERKEV